MTDSLEVELDTLFQLPPAAMVEARNALADRLKKSGDRDKAAQIKSLKRPAVAAWAINQVFFRHTPLLERARVAVQRLRELHASDAVDPRQLSAAVDEQRAAIQAAVDAAMRCCESAQLPGGAPLERKIFTTVQGWLAGAGDEAPGRMTHEIEPGGFAAIGAVGVPAPLRSQPVAPAPVATADVRAEVERQALERATLQVVEHKQRAEAALARVDQCRAKQAAAEAESLRAKLDVEDAERALADRRDRLAARLRTLEDAQQAVREAERLRGAADAALEEVRAELRALQSK